MVSETLPDQIGGASKPTGVRGVTIWLVACLGTVAAGTVFGMIAGGVFGLCFGPVFAGVFGVPVIVSFAFITWAFWLTRFTVLMAALAGGCTGFIATALTWVSIFETDFPTSLLLASLIGALGGGTSAGWYWTKYPHGHSGNAADDPSAWRYSLRDLFFRFTIVVLLVACWTFAVNTYLTAERAAERFRTNDWSEIETLL
jgi:hypothetical protein